jgi:tetratricopeptide (TPR) repeat protein
MEFPDWETPENALEYNAVKLFMQSAQRANPSFELQADDLQYVARICRLTQGMPLAILLAAAWIEMLTPQEIAAEIAKSPDFLETDLRDVPERQRSIRAVFDYSWTLLTEREREVFQALSVFRGGFTRQAAQAVAGASLRELMRLLDRSLFHRMPSGRYGAHELLRQYAEDRLNRSPDGGEEVRDRHCARYTAALQHWWEDLKGPWQTDALAEMNLEIENVRAAWIWATKYAQIARLEQGLDGLCAFCAQRARYQEGKNVCQMAVEALTRVDPQTVETSDIKLRLLSKTLAWQSRFTTLVGRFEHAMEQSRESLAILDRPELAGYDTRRERAFALNQMGWMVFAGDREEAQHYCEQSLALYRELDDPWWTSNVLIDIAQATHDLGAFDEAKQLYEESLAIRRALDDQIGITEALAGLSLIAWVQGHLEESEELARESLDISQETGDPFTVARGLRGVGEALIRLGQFAKGRMSMEESHAAYVHLGSDYYSALTNMFLSEANAHQGRYDQARAAGEAALSFCQSANLEWDSGFALYTLGLTALGTGDFTEAQQLLEASSRAFREIDHRENLSWVLALLGYASRALGQPDQAHHYLVESLHLAVDIGAFLARVYALPAIALFLADQGQQERAIELYVLASRYGFVSNSHWFDQVAGQHIAAVAETLPPEVAAAAWDRGHARDLDTTIQELLAELEQ